MTDEGRHAEAFDSKLLARTSAAALMTAHYGSLDAATLVFLHSVLDAVAFNCCQVTAFHAPQDWEQDLKNTQVPLLDAKSNPYEQLLKLKLDERFEKFERDGLLANMDRLFARCQPPAGWSPMHGYVFERERIKSFDSQRHEIIHGNAFGKPLALFGVSDESLHYVSQTALYLMGLVNLKYGLKIYSKYVGDYLQQRNR